MGGGVPSAGARDVPRATLIALIVVGVLYLGIASASLLVLGDRAATTDAPLADLLAIGVGGQVRVLTAVVAVLLTLGAMNACYAGAAKLGDGTYPDHRAYRSWWQQQCGLYRYIRRTRSVSPSGKIWRKRLPSPATSVSCATRPGTVTARRLREPIMTSGTAVWPLAPQ